MYVEAQRGQVLQSVLYLREKCSNTEQMSGLRNVCDLCCSDSHSTNICI